MNLEGFETLLVTLFVLALIFFALRELWTWYWKINLMLERQQAIIDEQKETNRILRLLAKAEVAKQKKESTD